ncbi:MAG: hypothetical protein HRT72_02445 [Flavobacteriales bacterium]|nr:hypothetical protein [Flavobacteriales bacterium]
MNNFKLYSAAIILAIFSFGINFNGYSQCDTIATLCEGNFSDNFVSDGQSYRALLLGEQNAEFHSTFYGGSTYRISGCTGLKNGNLEFSLFDEERNLLFSNKEFSTDEYRNAPYWDFKIESTINCIIEARLNGDNLASGCAVLLIGFKQ